MVASDPIKKSLLSCPPKDIRESGRFQGERQQKIGEQILKQDLLGNFRVVPSKTRREAWVPEAQAQGEARGEQKGMADTEVLPLQPEGWRGRWQELSTRSSVSEPRRLLGVPCLV